MSMFTSFKSLADVNEALNYQVKSAERSIAKWKAEFDATPAYALSWGMGVFSDSAKLAVAKELQQGIKVALERGTEEAALLSSIRKMALDKVVRGAQYPERSSSPTSNLMGQEITAAWSEILRAFDYLDRE